MHTEKNQLTFSVALVYAMDLYIDVYTTYAYVYMYISKLHTCIKPVSLIFSISWMFSLWKYVF